MSYKFRAAMTLAAGFIMCTSYGQAAQLKIGDPAPKLQVAKWVQGEPVESLDPGKVYVVEFWATWCGPCRASIPHLNALYEKFKDKGLIVIGQNVWEQQEDGVVPFVQKMGTNMTYRVALDDKSHEEKGAMAVAWMEAAGLDGIPSAFIVQKGRIAWIGHPMEMTEKLLDDVLSGHYDIGKAEADYEKQQAAEKQMEEFSRKLNAAVRAQNWDEAYATLDDMEKSLPKDSVDPKMIRFRILLLQKKYDEAYRLAGSISEAHAENADLQNELAWTLAARPGLEKRDTVLAEKIAERANTASKGKDATVLDTLARTQFMNGKKDEAVATEQKAVNLAEGELQGQLKNSLASYQDGKLPELGISK